MLKYDDDIASLNLSEFDDEDVLDTVTTSNTTTSKAVSRTVGKHKTIIQQAAARKTHKTVTPGSSRRTRPVQDAKRAKLHADYAEHSGGKEEPDGYILKRTLNNGPIIVVRNGYVDKAGTFNFDSILTRSFHTTNRAELTCERLQSEANEKEYGGPAPEGIFLRRIRAGIEGAGIIECVRKTPKRYAKKTAIDRYKKAKGMVVEGKRVMNAILQIYFDIKDDIEGDIDVEFNNDMRDDARLEAYGVR